MGLYTHGFNILQQLQSIISDTTDFKKQKIELPGPGSISSISKRITSHHTNTYALFFGFICFVKEKLLATEKAETN